MHALSSPSGQSRTGGRSGHPLEAIAFFRRFPASTLRDLVYTLIWNTGFVIVFTVLSLLLDDKTPLLHTLWINFVIANCIGFTIHFAFRTGKVLWGDALHKLPFAVRALYYAGISVMGVFAGYWVGFTLLDLGGGKRWMLSTQGSISILLFSLIISLFIASMFYARERQATAEADFQRERARTEAAERHAKVAQLKLLEAQVEPHFLYNTLANVISLIDSQPGTAKHMVERLIDYLRRAAVAGDVEATLGTQLALLRAYLDLIVLRMGSRLTYHIDVPDALMTQALPPMLLQPLVENAIKHGLEPKVEGGGVVVSARREGDRLLLRVSDDGLGVRSTRSSGSTGLGLANLRDRLSSMYAGRARMTLEDLAPGTRVTLELPATPA